MNSLLDLKNLENSNSAIAEVLKTMSFNQMIDNQILVFVSSKDNKDEEKKILQKRETIVQIIKERRKVMNQKRLRQNKRTKLNLLEKFIQRNPEGGSVTCTNIVDPVVIKPNAEIDLSENFKQKVLFK
mmetsp:Transcript_41413/g.47747  ORF Transcript_41413/g.47747 Transcript_41413/m.47747 type:complete len:128 (-) Transcript_41413:537-920(-)